MKSREQKSLACRKENLVHAFVLLRESSPFRLYRENYHASCTHGISSHCFNAWRDGRDKSLMRQRRRIVRYRLLYARRGFSNTLPHAAAPDAPWVQIVARHPVQGAEWDEREDYTVWTSRQGHPVHQGRLLSRWLLLVPPCPLPIPSPPSSTPLPSSRPLIICLLRSLLSPGPSLRHPLRCADTSQQPTTLYYSKVISLSAPLGTLPSFIRGGDKPRGYFYG